MDSNILFEIANGVNDSYKKAFEEGFKAGYASAYEAMKAMKAEKEVLKDKEDKDG